MTRGVGEPTGPAPVLRAADGIRGAWSLLLEVDRARAPDRATGPASAGLTAGDPHTQYLLGPQLLRGILETPSLTML